MTTQPINAASIKALLETASGTIDGMQYAVDRAFGRLNPELMEGLIVCQKMTEMALSHSAERAWQGGPYIERSRFANLAEYQVKQALENMDQTIPKDIHLDIAINDKSEYVHRYLTKDKALEGDDLDAMDTAFKGWLANNNVVVQDGTMYLANEKGKGEPLQDKQGNNLRADPEMIRNQMMDPEKGFAAYMHTHKQFKIEVQSVEYPTNIAPSI